MTDEEFDEFKDDLLSTSFVASSALKPLFDHIDQLKARIERLERVKETLTGSFTTAQKLMLEAQADLKTAREAALEEAAMRVAEFCLQKTAVGEQVQAHHIMRAIRALKSGEKPKANE